MRSSPSATLNELTLSLSALEDYDPADLDLPPALSAKDFDWNAVDPATAAKPAPLTYFMKGLWLANLSLQRRLRLATAVQRTAFMVWYAFIFRSSFSKSNSSRPDAPFPESGPVVEWCAQQADDAFWKMEGIPTYRRPCGPVPKLFAAAWCQDQDFQRMFELHKEEGYTNFLCHIVTKAAPAATLPFACVPDFVFEAVNKPHESAVSQGPRAITKALHYLWRNDVGLSRQPFKPVLKGYDLLFYLSLLARNHLDPRLIPDAMLSVLKAPSKAHKGFIALDHDILEAAGAPMPDRLTPQEATLLREAITEYEKEYALPAVLARVSAPQEAVAAAPAEKRIRLYEEGTGLSQTLFLKSRQLLQVAGMSAEMIPSPKNDAVLKGDIYPTGSTLLWHGAPENAYDSSLRYTAAFKGAGKRIGIFPSIALPFLAKPQQLALRFFDEVWANNHRDAANCIAAGVPAQMLGPVIAPPAKSALYSRAYFDLPASGFLALAIAPPTQQLAASNPMACIETFQAVFEGNDDATLALCVPEAAYTRPSQDHLAQVQEAAFNDPRIHLMAPLMRPEELYGLLRVTDLYMALPRYQGDGFEVMAATAVGTPVLAANAFGNEHIASRILAATVKTESVQIDPEEIEFLHEPVAYWHQHDPAHAIWLMKKMVEGEGKAQLLEAQTFISANYSPAVLAQRVRARIAELERDI